MATISNMGQEKPQILRVPPKKASIVLQVLETELPIEQKMEALSGLLCSISPYPYHPAQSE